MNQLSPETKLKIIHAELISIHYALNKHHIILDKINIPDVHAKVRVCNNRKTQLHSKWTQILYNNSSLDENNIEYEIHKPGNYCVVCEKHIKIPEEERICNLCTETLNADEDTMCSDCIFGLNQTSKPVIENITCKHCSHEWTIEKGNWKFCPKCNSW